ncbi:gelsolin domain containing protein [Niveomyces insectorum RCEF 264]|uniref:Gelsolin domain containing protein n=1 Tax=Niveomyces insectorum RCEF 264 TaxID=1081102 RepID=A0A167RI07_9HYPO|nr:gelsolin domain containing protein [Niveomyces insectorum RCEF 264]
MSDEVTDFLRSVEQLKDRRLEEDEARSRELEETILQEKRERQARRAERARSISPQKSSPANTPPPPLSSHHRYTSSQTSDGLKLTSSPPVVLDSPRSPTSRAPPRSSIHIGAPNSGISSSNNNNNNSSSSSNVVTLNGPSSPSFLSSSSPTKENESPFDADAKTPGSSSITRTPTLSWQRRPTSNNSQPGSERPKSRPLSIVAAENAAARSSVANAGASNTNTNTNTNTSTSTGTPNAAVLTARFSPEPNSGTFGNSSSSDLPASRDQIAQALSSKDPAWFRQTADRGLNSAAYRRDQVEDRDRQDLTNTRAQQLPGMSRGIATSPETSDGGLFSPKSTTTTATATSLQIRGGAQLSPSLPLMTTHKLDPPQDVVVALPSAGRTSPTRPLSPTKGAGGFVQSAMMKRSDSVKRWSVTSPPGLQRADSVASSRTGLESPRRSATTLPRPSSSSRPTSSHDRSSAANSRPSTPTRLQSFTSEEKEEKEADEAVTKVAANDGDTGDSATQKTTTTPPPPSSPSKTMDPRRWSPTKTSSWLEAALNKPESPKPKVAPPPNNQPAWMVELNKAKAQKAGHAGAADVTRMPSVARKHEVKTGGLLRTSPMGATAVSGTAVSVVTTTAAATASPLPGRGALGSHHSPSTSVSSNSGKLGTGTTPPKPGTPPKNDFRANLKPKQPLPADAKGGDVNELANVFGTLRRSKTQNYVAPDTLKENILRGKSALNVTGGPKPREKKDELKEAILQKKAEFQQAKSTGRGIATNAARATGDSPPLPEGVMKRLEMSRTGGSRSVTPEQRHSTSAEAPSDGPFRPPEKPDPNPAAATTPTPLKTGLSGTAIVNAGKEPEAHTVAKDTASASRGPRLGGGGSALASRFNPALAGILARGPPGAASGGETSSASASAPAPASFSSRSEAGGSSKPDAQLTHMTKNRARGPRRKAPSTLRQPTAAEEPAKEQEAVATPKKSPPATTPKKADLVAPQVISLVDSARKAAAPEPVQASHLKSPPSAVVSLVDSSRTRPAAEEPVGLSKPSVVSLVDSAKVASAAATPRSPRSPIKLHEQVAAIAARNNQPAKPVATESKTDKAPLPSSQPSSPRKINVKRMSKFLEESANQSTATAAAEVRPLSPSKTGGARSIPEPRPLSPQKTGGNARPLPVAPVLPKKEWQAGRGPVTTAISPATPASSISPRSKVFADAPSLGTAPSKFSPSPSPSPASTRRAEPPSPALTSPALPSPMRSPSKHAQEASAMLSQFFGPARPGRTYRADAADVLAKRPSVDQRISTIKAELFRVASDGKKQPVPAHHERVLFEREMYLCPHTFTNGSGKKTTEVYFWAGDDVPEAAVQDVQVFLGREARAHGGKLVKLRQGKETAEFLQALGGIVMIRRGSSNKYDSLAPSMFCGRRYLGQVTFDEVDFAPASLCSGFPYLLTQQGKCYLWKGKGSSVDELSCARLIGMDLALMGELLEVEDGNEPAAFWQLFGSGAAGGSKAGSADHWRLKPKYDRYLGRLFSSDNARREQIVEIHPFDQRDLSPDGIYVLDAFFELYIIVGHRSQTQYVAFHNALDFAQEYAILAAGMEDRPFVPISTVVLEGIPRDLKRVFRKWSDAASPTRTVAAAAAAGAGAPPSSSGPTSPASIKRGRSLRIVPLTVALQALAD